MLLLKLFLLSSKAHVLWISILYRPECCFGFVGIDAHPCKNLYEWVFFPLQDEYQYDHLQKVLNAAARATCLIPKFEHISPVLMRLHWLPIKYRVEYKIALLVFKAMHGLSPGYIMEFINAKPVTRYSLRSDSGIFLQGSCLKCKTFGERAFVHIVQKPGW